MSIHFSSSEANGLGTCAICKTKIEKGNIQVVASGYNTSGRVHLDCIVKMIKENKTPWQIQQEIRKGGKK